MGSDWNVSTANVMEEIDVAIHRTGPEGGTPLGADQSLTPTEALTAFTIGSAYINHSESSRGSLKVGKQADLVVFDGDPFPDAAFGETRVLMTVAGGRLVYEDGHGF
jgi:hypothetical protein